MTDYIETGKLKYVFRDFPLSFHNNSMNAAKAASCAGEQKKYWAMHDILFKNQRAMNEDDLDGYAEKLGLDMEAFKTCFASDKYANEANKDMADGKKAGVRGTPGFFIGFTDPHSKEIKGKFIKGAKPYAAFKKVLDSMLSEAKSK
jgi:protein-disulfide isomerase